MQKHEVIDRLNELKLQHCKSVFVVLVNSKVYGSNFCDLLNFPEAEYIYLKEEDKTISYSQITNIKQIC